MKILIIGGNGTIGKTITAHFSKEDEVVVAGRSSGDVTVDIASAGSIIKMFETVGTVDAIINVAGDAKWDTFDNLSEEDFYIGIKSKMMGQVNLVRLGRKYLNDGGSITLTTGILADEPVYMTTSAAMVNGAIQSFVMAVALELDRGLRVNVVSADLVEDAFEKYKDFFPGNTPVPMDKVVAGYIKSVKGKINGAVIRIRG
ncbi:short chain dehydrogenase [Dokdonia sp. MED134]|uniref:short chain dehydrogenase n=1 Tax=Dokdonia sp. MED134 TaxID=313590 RepID=UPI000068DBC9|nr:short chain dehydrogenase [Dokdonia sp. MED134]EAQ38561.1 short chain dehydrogenase [Dokdonia sp. MED134]